MAEFLHSCKSKHTARGYKTALNKFFGYAAIEKKGFNPDAAIKIKPDKINPIVLKYAMHLKSVAKTTGEFKRGEVSANSVGYYLNPIKQFFDYYEISLSWKKINRFIPERTAKQYHVYSREEIKKLLSVANHRERVIILVLLSSGIRAEALLQLQIRDFEVIPDNPDNVGHLVVYARSAQYYHTFCTPEAVAAIQFYLKWRQEMGEELKPESPLIRDYIKDGFSRKTKHPQPITYIALYDVMQKLLRKAGISTEKKYSLQPNHAFRKAMNTIVANAKANPLFKEVMMGHSINLDNIYYNRDDPQSLKALLEEYTRAVDALTINDEYRLKKRVAELEVKARDGVKVDQLEKMVAESKLESQLMMRQIAELKEKLNTSNSQNEIEQFRSALIKELFLQKPDPYKVDNQQALSCEVRKSLYDDEFMKKMLEKVKATSKEEADNRYNKYLEENGIKQGKDLS